MNTTGETIRIALNEPSLERFEIVQADSWHDGDQIHALPRQLWDDLCATRATLAEAWTLAARAEQAAVAYVMANNPDAGYPWDEWAAGGFVFSW
ncbi:MAG TPA: hypothetical protein VHA75_07960, partial [Rugosimonospora sp.]|nr:hypothetical protein [Rugosimonospora sp.]